MIRELSLNYKGVELQFSPNVKFLAQVAQALAQVSGGTVNTLTLAQQFNIGGAEPVYAATVMALFLKACGIKDADADRCYVDHVMKGDENFYSFRLAYIAAIVPDVDFGKKPDAPAPRPKKKSVK